MRNVSIEDVFTWMFPVEGAPFFFNFTDDNQNPVQLLQAGYQALGKYRD